MPHMASLLQPRCLLLDIGPNTSHHDGVTSPWSRFPTTQPTLWDTKIEPNPLLVQTKNPACYMKKGLQDSQAGRVATCPLLAQYWALLRGVTCFLLLRGMCLTSHSMQDPFCPFMTLPRGTTQRLGAGAHQALQAAQKQC